MLTDDHSALSIRSVVLLLIAEGLSPIASTALFDLDLAGRGHGYLIALAVDPAKSHEAKRMPHSGSATGGKGGKRCLWQNRACRVERLLGKRGLHVSYRLRILPAGGRDFIASEMP
jgi:hypothetical protein